MKNTLLYSGIALTLIGFVGRLYAANYSYVHADNILRDSAWLPIGSFMFIAGVLLLLAVFIQKGIKTFRKNSTQHL